jgi:hypothetical protein
MEIFVRRSLEIGQPVSAASAAVRNASADAPATFPDTFR